jgi:predicted nucleotidyltransferase
MRKPPRPFSGLRRPHPTRPFGPFDGRGIEPDTDGLSLDDIGGGSFYEPVREPQPVQDGGGLGWDDVLNPPPEYQDRSADAGLGAGIKQEELEYKPADLDMGSGFGGLRRSPSNPRTRPQANPLEGGNKPYTPPEPSPADAEFSPAAKPVPNPNLPVWKGADGQPMGMTGTGQAESAGMSMWRGVERNIGSAAGGTIGSIAGTVLAGLALTAIVSNPAGWVVGLVGLAGGIAGSLGGMKVGQAAQDALMGEEETRRRNEQFAIDQAEHPYATFAGAVAPHLVGFAAESAVAKGIGTARAANAASRSRLLPAGAKPNATALKAMEGLGQVQKDVQVAERAVRSAKTPLARETALSGLNAARSHLDDLMQTARANGAVAMTPRGQRAFRGVVNSSYLTLEAGATLGWTGDSPYNFNAPEYITPAQELGLDIQNLGERLLTDEEAAKVAESRGAKEFWNSVWQNVSEGGNAIGYLPVFGSLHNARYQHDIERRLRKLNGNLVEEYGPGYETNPEYLADVRRVTADTNLRAIEAKREQTIRGLAADIAMQSLPFMLEIGIAPNFIAGRAESGMATRAAASLGNMLAKAPFNVTGTLNRQEQLKANTWSITPGEWDALNVAVEKSGDSELQALWKAWADNGIEYLSEGLGEVAQTGLYRILLKKQAPGRVVRFLKQMVDEAPPPGSVRSMLKAGGSQPLFEGFEERAGDFMRILAGIDEHAEDLHEDGTPVSKGERLVDAFNPISGENWRQWGAEFLAFSIPGAAQAASGLRAQRRAEASGAASLEEVRQRTAEHFVRLGMPDMARKAAAAGTPEDIRRFYGEAVTASFGQALMDRAKAELDAEQMEQLDKTLSATPNTPAARAEILARFLSSETEMERGLAAAASILSDDGEYADASAGEREALAQRAANILSGMVGEWADIPGETAMERLENIVADANLRIRNGTLDPSAAEWKKADLESLQRWVSDRSVHAATSITVRALVDSLDAEDRAQFDRIAFSNQKTEFLDRVLRSKYGALNANFAVARYVIDNDLLDTIPDAMAQSLSDALGKDFGGFGYAVDQKASVRDRLRQLTRAIREDERNKAFLDLFVQTGGTATLESVDEATEAGEADVPPAWGAEEATAPAPEEPAEPMSPPPSPAEATAPAAEEAPTAPAPQPEAVLVPTNYAGLAALSPDGLAQVAARVGVATEGKKREDLIRAILRKQGKEQAAVPPAATDSQPMPEAATHAQPPAKPRGPITLHGNSSKVGEVYLGKSDGGTGTQRIGVSYRVVEAADIEATRKRGEVQERDESVNPALAGQVEQIANRLDFRQVAESPDATMGAPILTKAGVALAGNGRAMGIKKAYAEGKAGAYRDALLAWARENGLGDVSELKQPVLVRIVVDNGGLTDAQIALLSNRTTGAAINNAETAMGFANAILRDSNLFGTSAQHYNGMTLGELLRDTDFVRRLQKAVGWQGATFTQEGRVTPEFEDNVRRAMVIAALAENSDTKDRMDLIRRLSNDQSEGIKAIVDAVADTAPSLLAMKKNAAYGDVSILKEVGDAMAIVASLRADGLTVNMWTGQGSLAVGAGNTVDYRNVEPVTRALVEWFGGPDHGDGKAHPSSKEKNAALLKRYIQLCGNRNDAALPGMEDALPTGKTAKWDTLRQALRAMDEEVKEGPRAKFGQSIIGHNDGAAYQRSLFQKGRGAGRARTPTEAEKRVADRITQFVRAFGVDRVVFGEIPNAERRENESLRGALRDGTIYLEDFNETTLFHEIAHALWLHARAGASANPRMARLMREMRAIANSAPESVYDQVLTYYDGKDAETLLNELFAHYMQIRGREAWMNALREENRPWIVRIWRKITEFLESAAGLWVPGMKSKYRDVRTGLWHVAQDLASGRDVDIEGLLGAAESGEGENRSMADDAEAMLAPGADSVASMPIGQVRRELVKRGMSPVGDQTILRGKLRERMEAEAAEVRRKQEEEDARRKAEAAAAEAARAEEAARRKAEREARKAAREAERQRKEQERAEAERKAEEERKAAQEAAEAEKPVSTEPAPQPVKEQPETPKAVSENAGTAQKTDKTEGVPEAGRTQSPTEAEAAILNRCNRPIKTDSADAKAIRDAHPDWQELKRDGLSFFITPEGTEQNFLDRNPDWVGVEVDNLIQFVPRSVASDLGMTIRLEGNPANLLKQEAPKTPAKKETKKNPRDSIIPKGMQNDLGTIKLDVAGHFKEKAPDGVEIVGIDFHGSRLRGDSREDSDLDAVVEYKGDAREDDLFNMLNEEPLVVDGVKVDINPIRADKTGTLEAFMERSRKYDDGKRKKAAADEFSSRILDAIETDARDGLISIHADNRFGDGAYVANYAAGSKEEVERAAAGIRKAFPDMKVLVSDTGLVIMPRKESAEQQTQAEEPKQDSSEEPRARLVQDIKAAYLAALKEKDGAPPIKNIHELRRRAAKHGVQARPGGQDDAELQELFELGLVQAAREALQVRRGKRQDLYKVIVRLYNMQMTAGRRDSEREEKQQFSTPLPMGFVADWFVYGSRDKSTINSLLEPTAGNGMLLISIPPGIVHANEISKRRLENLRAQGFKRVTEQDALDAWGETYDAIVANPPFGESTRTMTRDGREITGLDRQMAVNMLESMADDGRAAIIIGGNIKYRPNGTIGSNLSFFAWLYDHYNVKGIINMEGDLYRKQGTKFPTMMILVDGRRSEEERARTRVYPPTRENAAGWVDNFDDLYMKVAGILRSEKKHDGYEQALQSPRTSGVPVSGEPSGQTGTQGHPGQSPEGHTQLPGLPGELGAGPSGQLVQGGRVGGRSDGGQPAAGNGGTGDRGGSAAPDRGAAVDGPGSVRGPGAAAAGDGGAGAGTLGNQQPGREGGSRGSAGHADERDNGGSPAQPDRVGLKRPKGRQTITAESEPYRQHSRGTSLGSIAPAYMADAMDRTIDRIESRNGKPIDESVREALGYGSKEELHKALAAEQVDSVGMAIDRMADGRSCIIGDQTGIGKGRQMAALIRFARNAGHKPIFFTVRAPLFSDIYRDMADIGSGNLRPLIINSGADAVIRDAEGNVVYRQPKNIKEILNSGVIPDEYDYVVCTYSQFSNIRGLTSAAKATFIQNLAAGNYVFLDESHYAAGDSNTGRFMRNIVGNAKGATFASATASKRADTMPLYLIRSKAGSAVGNEGGGEDDTSAGRILSILRQGGGPVMEIFSRALTESGEMIRRERDMRGVENIWETVADEKMTAKVRRQYDSVINLFNAICDFQQRHVKHALDAINEHIRNTAGYVENTKGTSNMGVDNTPLFNQTYNYVRQMLLAMKVEAIVEHADAELKAGRKPVIALENTMEAALAEYSPGSTLENDTFGEIMKRGLHSCMKYTETDAEGNKINHVLSPSQLSPEGEAEYNRLVEQCNTVVGDVYISPVDAIVEGLRARGYSVGELSGRNSFLERDENGRSVVRQRSAAQRNGGQLARDFNSGKLDALIVGKTGSTGISLHASERFADQRQRTMIIAQPMGNVAEYQQMAGRIDRTGQVHRGRYIHLSLPVAAEQRFNMMLARKLKTLNAATTTSQEREADRVDTTDILNRYGARVALECLREHPEIYNRLRDPLDCDTASGITDGMIADAGEEELSKILSRISWLPTKLQEEFYDDIGERYAALINYLDEIGENELKISVLPLGAKTIRAATFAKGSNPSSQNPLDQDAMVEEVDAAIIRKPMKAAEVRALMARLAGKEESSRVRLEKLLADFIKRAPQDLAENARKHVRDILRTFAEGQPYLLPSEDIIDGGKIDVPNFTSNNAAPGILVGFRTGKKYSASSVRLVFATLSGLRRLEIPLSNRRVVDQIANLTRSQRYFLKGVNLDRWDSLAKSESREKRYILTGNLLRALSNTYDDASGRYTGKIITYTDSSGSVHDGILMPKKWNPKDILDNAVLPISSALDDLRGGTPAVTSADGKVIIYARYPGFSIVVPKSRVLGEKYFLDPRLRELVRDGNFFERGRNKVAEITRDNLEAVLERLDQLGVRVRDNSAELAWEEEGTLKGGTLYQRDAATARDWSTATIPEMRRELVARGLSPIGGADALRKRLEGSDGERTGGETLYSRDVASRSISRILSGLDKARGKTREEIFREFDNTQLVIGGLPDDLELPRELDVKNRVVMGGQAYILDHLLNRPEHERPLSEDDARRLLSLIDPKNEMRKVPQRGSYSLAFIAQNPESGWDCTVIAPRRGEFYVFKTMFAQEKKPYQGQALIRYSAGSGVRDKAVDSLLRGPLASIRDNDRTKESRPQNGRTVKGGDPLYQIDRLYTGSAADYAHRRPDGSIENGPGLHKVGTGEGAQVYGWGLYATDRRGVAEGYAARMSEDLRREQLDFSGNGEEIAQSALWVLDRKDALAHLRYEAENIGMPWWYDENPVEDDFDVEGKKRDILDAIDWIERHPEETGSDEPVKPHIYEQTFFTNRPEGDESHLMEWYSGKGVQALRRKIMDALPAGQADDFRRAFNRAYRSGPGGSACTVWNEDVYNILSEILGSKKAASEFLRDKCDIDGVKYPVDSYGKTVKDGDTAGWNYVSFRDENIRVDHKWRDGEMLYSRDSVSAPEVDRWFDAEIVKRRRGGRTFYDIKSGDDLIGQGYRSKEAAEFVLERERSMLDLAREALERSGGLDAGRLAGISEARRRFVALMKDSAASNEQRAEAFEIFAKSIGLHKDLLEQEWKHAKAILTADSPAQGEMRASVAARAATTVLARLSIRLVSRDMEKFFREKLDKALPAGGMRRNVLVGVADARAAMDRKTSPEEIRRKIDAAESRRDALDDMLSANEDASGNPLSEEDRAKAVREHAEKCMELRILRAFEGLKHNHPGKTAASLLDDLDAWNNARAELDAIARQSIDDIARIEAERSEMASMDRAIVLDELTGGKPIPPSSEQHTLNAQHPLRRQLFDTMRGWFAGILGGGSAWGEFLTRKKGVGYMQGHAAKLLHEGAAAGQAVEDTMNEEDGRHFIALLNRFTKKNLDPEHSIKDMSDWYAYCSELYLERKENDIRFRKVSFGSEKNPDTGKEQRVAVITPGEHCHFSIDELMHIYLIGLQAQEAAGQPYTDLPKKRKGVDTSLMESMLKGGYSAQTMREISAVLARGGYDEMAIAISEDMERKAPLLDQLMERIFHSRLKRVKYYCPLRRTHYGLLEKGDKGANGTGQFMSLVRSFLKERVSNHRDIKPTHLISVWQSHNRQANHIIANADWISRMARIFRSQEIQGALDWVLGTKARQMFNSWLDIQARGGSLQFDNGVADEIGRTFARVQTQTPRVAIKQTTSPTAAVPYLPEWASLTRWHADLAKIIINRNLRRRFITMLAEESPSWRLRGTFASDIQAMAARENAARTKPGRIYRLVGTKLNRKLGAMTSWGDKLGAVLGCYGIYRAWERKLLKDGKSAEEVKRVALDKFVEAMNGSQQSAVPEYVSHYQTLGNAYRFLSMFMSAQIAMTRNYILKAKARKEGRISKLEFAKTVYGITTAQFLFRQASKLFRPGLMTLAGVAAWMLGHGPDPDDDDDEHPAWETLKDGAHALLATPFSGLFIIGPVLGEVVEYLIDRSGHKMGLEKRKPRAPQIASALLPAAESLEDLVPLVLDAPEQIMGLDKMSPDERERFLRKAADAISLATGNSLPKVLAETGAGAYDAWTADDLDLLQRAARALSFSRSAIGAPRRKPTPKQPTQEDPWAIPAGQEWMYGLPSSATPSAGLRTPSAPRR